MTMKRALADVRDVLDELAASLRELAIAIDDCPTADADLAVIDALRTHAIDAQGDLHETATIVSTAIEAEEVGDVTRAARRIADAHERFNALGRRVRFDLSGHSSLFAVESLPAQRGIGWRSWSEVVLRQLEQIDHAMHCADAAFVGCWQEVADRSPSAVTVSNTQTITAP